MKPAAVALAVSALVGIAESAHAYPHYQISSGTSTCNQCHWAPAGGGLLTEWGRDESADTLSWGGQGAFLHGVLELPDWLDLGGDIRLAALAHDTGSADGAELAAFPMQADLAARLQLGGGWSALASVGHRGAVRHADLAADSERSEASIASALISREHYVSWSKSGQGPYARLGRFFAPYGLRLPDHTSYVRRYAGFNLLEETYGLSGGYLGSTADVHFTLYVSDELRWAPRRELGGAAMAEWRAGNLVFGASSRFGAGGDVMRALAGGFAKWWMESAKILWMAEADLVWKRFEEADGETRFETITHLGPVWMPAQGLSVSVAYELYDEDVQVSGLARHAFSTWVSLLPMSHLELFVLGRFQRIGTEDHAVTALVQLHYYL